LRRVAVAFLKTQLSGFWYFCQTLKKRLFFLCGIMLVIVATIGIFVPLLPTTPFLLLAAACFLKSSDRAYQWLLNNKIYGKYIRNYIEKKGIPLRIKVFTLLLLWISIAYAFLFATDHVWVRAALLIVLAGVSTHILLIRTKKK